MAELRESVQSDGRRSLGVHLKEVSKSYGATQAVRPLSLDIAPGELLALLGPSGCGKTTTLRIVAGFERPDTGSVVVGERDITLKPPNERRLGMVFQNYSLFPHMTVAENVAFGLRMQGRPKPEISQRVARMLDTVRLSGFEARYPTQLSGGQQQRVALARALVTDPGVLLLDEPLGALDKNLREGMQFELRQLQKSLGITSVLVTHDQEEALTMADRVAVMSEGRILQVGSPTEVYDRPKSRFVSEFLGTSNVFEGVVAAVSGPEAAVDLAVGAASCRIVLKPDEPVEPERRVLVAVRPERVRIAPASAGTADGGAGIPVRVIDRVFRGSSLAYKLAAERREEPIISYLQAGAGTEGLEPGAAAVASWAPDAAVLLEDRP